MENLGLQFTLKQKAVLAMTIESYLEYDRVDAGGFPRRETRLLLKALQDMRNRPTHFPIFGIEKMETVTDICQIHVSRLLDIPTIGIGLKRLLNDILEKDDLAIGCLSSEKPV